MSQKCAVSPSCSSTTTANKKNGAADEATEMELALTPAQTNTIYSTMPKLVVGFDEREEDSDEDNGT
jgi:hypothetical protein